MLFTNVFRLHLLNLVVRNTLGEQNIVNFLLSWDDSRGDRCPA